MGFYIIKKSLSLSNKHSLGGFLQNTHCIGSPRVIKKNNKLDMISYLRLISFQLWLSKHPGIFDRKSCEILCFQLGQVLLPLQFQICYRIGNKVFDCFCIPQGIFQYKNGKSLYYLCNYICLLPPSQCEHRSFYIPWICLGIFLKWNKRLIKHL